MQPIQGTGQAIDGLAEGAARRPYAVVTGAAGALGGALARVLTGRGDRVALVDRVETAAKLAQLAEELGGATVARSYPTHALDSAAGWSVLPATLARDFGQAPTYAALLAGGWAGGTRLASWSDDEVWVAMMNANLETTHRALRGVLPGMLAAGHGSIVVIGSRVVERPELGVGAAAYTAAKAAVVALAQTVAAETRERGVRVNAVLPGTLDTPQNRKAMPGADRSRWVTLESASNVLSFLLSEAASDVTGATLPL